MESPLVGRYVFVRSIGKGGFGVVDEYKDLITGEDVAIKTIPPRVILQEVKRVIREVDIMSFLYNAHPHVINFSSIFATRNKMDVDEVSVPPPPSSELQVTSESYMGLSEHARSVKHHEALSQEVATIQKHELFSLHIVMPLMKGDLIYFTKLLGSESSQKKSGLSRDFLRRVAAVFAFQLFFGLDYLHRCGIVHRDIKPDNVLVRLDANVYYSSVCIADLGLARDAQESDTFYVCTRYYRPPEIVMTTERGKTSMDIWSMGCVLYEMCTGKTLFTMPTALDARGTWEGGRASTQLEVILNTVGTPSPEEIAMHMGNGNAKTYLERSVARPSHLRRLLTENWILHTDAAEKALWVDLITRCLAFFPQQRPTAAELCAHPLFVRYQIKVGENIHQTHTEIYRPTISEDQTKNALREDNKGHVLTLVNRVMMQTYPMAEEEEEDEHNHQQHYEEEEEDDNEEEEEEAEEEEEEEEEGYMVARNNNNNNPQTVVPRRHIMAIDNEEEDDDDVLMMREEEDEAARRQGRRVQAHAHRGDDEDGDGGYDYNYEECADGRMRQHRVAAGNGAMPNAGDQPPVYIDLSGGQYAMGGVGVGVGGDPGSWVQQQHQQGGGVVYDDDECSSHAASPPRQRHNNNNNNDAVGEEGSPLSDEDRELVQPSSAFMMNVHNRKGEPAAAAPTQQAVQPTTTTTTTAEDDARAPPAVVASHYRAVIENSPGGDGGADPYHYYGSSVYRLPSENSSHAASNVGKAIHPISVNTNLQQQQQQQQQGAPECWEEWAVPPLSPLQAPPPRGTTAIEDPEFPTLADGALRHQFAAVKCTYTEINDAIFTVLEDMGSCTHDPQRSADLRALLNFFTSQRDYTLKKSATPMI